MKTYTIVAGVNGAGKSSLIGILRTEVNNIGIIIDDSEKDLTTIDDCLKKGICFTGETTLSGHKTLATVKRAIEEGYYIRLYYVGLDTVEECILRIENRVKHGGHNINSDDVLRRFNKRFEDLLSILPYCNEATFYDNDNGFVTVGKYKNGEFNKIGQYSPKWFQELLSLQ